MQLPKPEKRAPRPRKRIARKTRPARVRKTSRAKLKKTADKLWSLIVRSAGQCCICGSTQRLQAAHGFSRRYLGTRHVLINGWCLCSGCHVRYTHDPIGWDEFMRRELGPEEYADLRQRAMDRFIPDYEQIITNFNTILAGK